MCLSLIHICPALPRGQAGTIRMEGIEMIFERVREIICSQLDLDEDRVTMEDVYKRQHCCSQQIKKHRKGICNIYG